jgi:hypothetical protein
VWALVAVFGVGLLGVLGVIAITFLGESSSSRFEPVEGPGFTTSGGGDSYGDNPAFDRLWDRCERGDGAACDDLFWESPVGSRYEEFGDTCGDRYEPDEVPFSCESAIGTGPR